MKVSEVQLASGRSIEITVVGEDRGRAVLYFHSPATSGEEMSEAASSADDANVKLVTVVRPTITCDQPQNFVARTAEDAEAVVEALEFGQPSILGWSGGAPYALATAIRLGSRVSSIHLVSPVPGPLTGQAAVPNQSERLRQVAGSTAESPWISGPLALRDYQAVAAPWPFDLQAVRQTVTISSPTDDEIVPPNLIADMQQQLPNAAIEEVTGTHAWLTDNWSTVLEAL